MKDNRTTRQLHENATGSLKLERNAYQLTEKTSNGYSKCTSVLGERTLKPREKRRQEKNKEVYDSWYTEDIKIGNAEISNSLYEQQEKEIKSHVRTEVKEEVGLKSKEERTTFVGTTKLKKAYQIALTLLEEYCFCNMNEQLYVFDMQEGYWKLIQESESNRTIRRMMPDDMCNAINKSVLYEIYEWLLSMAEVIKTFPAEKRFYINFKDCAVNWRTGKIEEERQELYFTYALDLKYSDVETRKNKKFLEFIEDVFGDDEKTKTEFYKFLGLALSDIRDLKISIFMYGPSNSGKSVFLNLLRQLVGERWCSSLSFTQMGNEFAITQLLGKRLNLSGEVSGASNKRLDIFKSLTGNDTVTACFKGKDHFQFKNESLLVFACNSLPEVNALEEFDSFLSRIIIFPFFKVKPREEWIDNLSELLMEDVGTILEVAMNGLQELEKANFDFKETKAMKQCKQEFIGHYNSFALFAEKCIEENLEAKITSDEIRKQYKIFCQNEGLIELADNIWSQLLKQRYACKSCTISEKSGFNERRIRGYRGISFKKKLEPNSEMPIFDWR